MPRRKRTDNSSDEPEEKKAKSNLCVGTHTVRWEWENDGGKWTAYNDNLAEKVCEGLRKKKSEILVDLGNRVQIKVLYDKSVQKNKVTGWERRIRIAFFSDSDYHVWEWEDEHGKWNPYGIQASIDLEDEYCGGKGDVTFVACHRSYTINVKKMEQLNDTTGVKRTVRRAESSADVPEKSEEEEIDDNKSAAEPAKGSVGKGKAANGSVGKGKGKGSVGKKGKSGGSMEKEEPEEKVKKFVKKGAAPVDPDCPKVETAHVYTEGKAIFDAMLNQTNLQNNNNKYYLMQLLEDDTKKSYSVWFRWGRVGKPGQNSLIPHGPDLDGAKRTFCQKFQDKTKNDWSNRNNFAKIPGKYDMVELDYSAGADEVDAPETSEPIDVPDSNLDQRLQDLINLICDVKSMEDAVVEMKYDAKKAPLGKLTASQIKAGYAALKKIETCINRNDMGRNIILACDEFYTRIPHDFGMRQPPIIRTAKDVKLKMQLLETLADIEVAMKIIKHQTSTENPIDTHYSDLKCDLSPLEKTDEMYKVLDKYLKNTHANTHNQYKMEILDIFEMNKDGESKQFNDVGNRMLLWHGSRLTNWMGILSQGLRIAPPEAPVTGYMFGKGVYFADISSKSANYCYATRSKNVGLVLLCDVALGKCNELLAADINASKLPSGTHSVMGKGMLAPDPKSTHVMSEGAVVPYGKPVHTGVNNPSGYTLNYNEFIVYDLSQIKMKYLMKVKFNFK